MRFLDTILLAGGMVAAASPGIAAERSLDRAPLDAGSVLSPSGSALFPSAGAGSDAGASSGPAAGSAGGGTDAPAADPGTTSSFDAATPLGAGSLGAAGTFGSPAMPVEPGAHGLLQNRNCSLAQLRGLTGSSETECR